jgi:2-succinyl-5-enolpyruvyl-6-hydroxy-3-cyclohexene-1-carboxylate synthase
VTSGTAVGELMPSVMEAFYSGLPLVVLSADRPRHYRGSGAPQSAEQKNIFGIYVSACLDIEGNENFDFFSFPKNKPVHINVCLSAPVLSDRQIDFSTFSAAKEILASSTQLFPRQKDLTAFINFLKSSENLLVLVSQIHLYEKKSVTQFLLNLGVPVYLEATSNIRELEELEHLKIYSPDYILENAGKSEFQITSILKIGGTPTHKLWRDVCEKKMNIQVFSISSYRFAGMPGIIHIETHLNLFFEEFFSRKICYKNKKNMKKFLEKDKEKYEKIKNLFLKYPNSEQSFVRFISNKVTNNSRVYLGNSLSIRNWDMAASYLNKNLYIEASRGLNGIDGQVSTFLGFACESQHNWALLGDLTVLYDLAGLWALKYREKLKLSLVVINNSGGKIFGRILSGKISAYCENNHQLNFQKWAQMWGLSSSFFDNIKTFHDFFEKNHPSQQLLEVTPNSLETQHFMKDYLSL